MRVTICGAAGLAAIGLLTLAPIGASAQENMKAEFALLGNRLWNTHSQVLAKHGQPTRIEIGSASGAQAGGGGGGGSMGGGMGAPMSMGSTGMGGAPGGSPYGNGGNPMARQYGGGGGGKMGGAMNPYAGGGGGLPGMPGMGMQGGGEMGGGQAMGGGSAGGNNASSGDEGEITWVYEKGPLTNIFLFNKDGRLIQVSSFGYSGGGAVTSRGVRLGDALGKIYALYGWTSNITKDAQRNTMALDYSKDHHVAFQLAEKNKSFHVVGITVGITELSQLNVFAPGVDFSNARRGMGGMGMMMNGGSGMGGGMGAPMMNGSMAPGGGGMSSGKANFMRGRAGGGGGGASAAGS